MTIPFLKSSPRLALAGLFLLAVAAGGCSDDSSDNSGGGPGASTTYEGLLAALDGQTGPLSITFASAVAAPPQQAGAGPDLVAGAPVDATGTLQLGGSGVVALTGTVDGDAVNLSGGGWTLTGTLSNGLISGTFTGPGAAGSWIAAAGSTTNPAIALCGSFSALDYTTNPPGEDFGSFSVVIAKPVVLGVAVGSEGEATNFTGTATASTITINLTTPEGTLQATGEYDEFGIGGSFEVLVGGQTISDGSFSGGTCEQPT